jgi:hypothetical protein
MRPIAAKSGALGHVAMIDSNPRNTTGLQGGEHPRSAGQARRQLHPGRRPAIQPARLLRVQHWHLGPNHPPADGPSHIAEIRRSSCNSSDDAGQNTGSGAQPLSLARKLPRRTSNNPSSASPDLTPHYHQHRQQTNNFTIVSIDNNMSELKSRSPAPNAYRRVLPRFRKVLANCGGQTDPERWYRAAASPTHGFKLVRICNSDRPVRCFQSGDAPVEWCRLETKAPERERT